MTRDTCQSLPFHHHFCGASSVCQACLGNCFARSAISPAPTFLFGYGISLRIEVCPFGLSGGSRDPHVSVFPSPGIPDGHLLAFAFSKTWVLGSHVHMALASPTSPFQWNVCPAQTFSQLLRPSFLHSMKAGLFWYWPMLLILLYTDSPPLSTQSSSTMEGMRYAGVLAG